MESMRTRQQAEAIVSSYLKVLYAYARKRTATLEDAEDLTQDICLKLYRTLLVRDDIRSIDKFVWTVAHNTLANYYRGQRRVHVGDIEPLMDILADSAPLPAEQVEKTEVRKRLCREIAYLSQTQRQVLIHYYYDGNTVAETAYRLGLPSGTVKWHLSAARTELKKGMETMKNLSELTFNPVQLESCGISGSVGSLGGPDRFLRSALAQNIAYAAYRKAMSVNDLADVLGVSPVYVESEVEFLEEYGLLLKEGNRYRTNILIDEPSEELVVMHDELYEQGAALIADSLCDELDGEALLKDDGIFCPGGDLNFLLWALLPYILSQSGEELMDSRISFEQGTTLRKDGGQNIIYTSVKNASMPSPRYSSDMKQWFGPSWNGTEAHILWSIDSPWSERRIRINTQQLTIGRDLQLLERFISSDGLSADELAYLTEKGYVRREAEGHFELAIVQIRNRETLRRLLNAGYRVKAACWPQLRPLRDAYIQAVLEVTPKHLRTMQGYGLQYLFFADGWFLLHCMERLLSTGRLQQPTEEQRRSLTTLFLPNNQL